MSAWTFLPNTSSTDSSRATSLARSEVDELQSQTLEVQPGTQTTTKLPLKRKADDDPRPHKRKPSQPSQTRKIDFTQLPPRQTQSATPSKARRDVSDSVSAQAGPSTRRPPVSSNSSATVASSSLAPQSTGTNAIRSPPSVPPALRLPNSSPSSISASQPHHPEDTPLRQKWSGKPGLKPTDTPLSVRRPPKYNILSSSKAPSSSSKAAAALKKTNLLRRSSGERKSLFPSMSDHTPNRLVNPSQARPANVSATTSGVSQIAGNRTQQFVPPAMQDSEYRDFLARGSGKGKMSTFSHPQTGTTAADAIEIPSDDDEPAPVASSLSTASSSFGQNVMGSVPEPPPTNHATALPLTSVPKPPQSTSESDNAEDDGIVELGREEASLLFPPAKHRSPPTSGQTFRSNQPQSTTTIRTLSEVPPEQLQVSDSQPANRLAKMTTKRSVLTTLPTEAKGAGHLSTTPISSGVDDEIADLPITKKQETMTEFVGLGQGKSASTFSRSNTMSRARVQPSTSRIQPNAHHPVPNVRKPTSFTCSSRNALTSRGAISVPARNTPRDSTKDRFNRVIGRSEAPLPKLQPDREVIVIEDSDDETSAPLPAVKPTVPDTRLHPTQLPVAPAASDLTVLRPLGERTNLEAHRETPSHADDSDDDELLPLPRQISGPEHEVADITMDADMNDKGTSKVNDTVDDDVLAPIPASPSAVSSETQPNSPEEEPPTPPDDGSPAEADETADLAPVEDSLTDLHIDNELEAASPPPTQPDIRLTASPSIVPSSAATVGSAGFIAHKMRLLQDRTHRSALLSVKTETEALKVANNASAPPESAQTSLPCSSLSSPAELDQHRSAQERRSEDEYYRKMDERLGLSSPIKQTKRNYGPSTPRSAPLEESTEPEVPISAPAFKASSAEQPLSVSTTSPPRHVESTVQPVIQGGPKEGENDDHSDASSVLLRYPTETEFDGDASEIEIDHMVCKRSITPTAALSPPRTPMSIKTEIQKVTFEMSRLFNEPSFKTSDDIPDVIEPHLNSLTQRQLRLADAKLIFEMKMAEAEDPDAPPIKIFNPIKGDKEPCPPFEFIYTNEMYHDKETGGPDHKNLKGCDCVGACDPSSKTCSCVTRQEYWTADPNNPNSNGFAYESDGRMKDGLQSYPIFECNWKCGCDETCTNRVVQKGRQCELNIVKTEKKGWGVYSGAKVIPARTFLGVYAGELVTTDKAEQLGKGKYNTLGRTYILDIDNWFLKDTSKPRTPEGFHAMPPPLPEDPDNWEAEFCVDAFQVGNFTRFLNHSCDPNVIVNGVYINDANFLKPLICLFAFKDIPAYTEICFSYYGLDDDDDVQEPVKDIKEGLRLSKCYCGAKKCKGIMFT